MKALCPLCGWEGDPEKASRSVYRNRKNCPSCGGKLTSLALRRHLPRPRQIIQPFDKKMAKLLLLAQKFKDKGNGKAGISAR